MSSASSNREAAATGTAGPQPAWKQELNDKIAAARAKRQAAQQSTGGLKGEVMKPGMVDSRASRVAATVAARYAQAPSYSEYMASEVRAAMTAAAEARASAYAEGELAEQMQALAATTEIAQPIPVMQAVEAAPAAARPVQASQPIPVVEVTAASIPPQRTIASPQRTVPPAPVAQPAAYEPSKSAIEDPFEDALVTPATPLPAKLLEFPRELVAARKARPRHAEGPLREETTASEQQLRIFEVEPEAISTTVEAVPHTTEWSSIRLDAYPPDYAVQTGADTVSSSYSREPYAAGGATSSRHESERAYQHQASYSQDTRPALVRVASLEDRLMAALVDCALVGIAFLLFTFVFAFSTVHPPTGRPAIIGGVAIIACFYLLYQLLFFSFSDSTPGMLYARIALCTFDEDNPTRTAMRKRIFALVLAAMPLGLGFLYALFDEDHLGWHDRMTRMYQRSYK